MRWDLGSGGGECEAQLECQETNLAVIVRKWEGRGFGGREQGGAARGRVSAEMMALN